METLESLVIEAFSSVPNNGLPQDDFKKFTGLAFNMSEFKKLYWVKPVKDIHQVGIDSCFQFPLLTSAATVPECHCDLPSHSRNCITH
jgi:hypothetical protein